ncbi:prepilin-type N-terminal cleavage/methylation domain-containing protein [Parvularcula flava]|uniref:Type II secretion system protein H n=1 Tax=Aquisalinus luteolus TaxID=1566827 RepID=A0A8J3AA47_9PROT|nr:GspH/FimT family pseudopilin [Aquisalinus luteolus]NHK29075.1 prepilin-type N-terminal cleavage/methylation domain-containing protein [Aquisalinus luteolus]GGI00388.1 hypothetical protein GCM10011355_28560 [Aquisalinus luteolus]
MRISATGKPSPLLRQRGLTLVEVLVVVLILGLMAGVVVMTLPSEEDTARIEAFHFAGQIKVAQELAVTRGEIVGLRMEESRYSFLAYRTAGWVPLVLPGAESADRTLQTGNVLSLSLDNEPVTGTAGGARPFSLSREDESEAPPDPDLVFLPTGLTPSFTVLFTGEMGDWQVVAGDDGTVMVEGADD